MNFDYALGQLLKFANEDDVVFMMHNKAHKYDAFYLEVQKRGLNSKYNIFYQNGLARTLVVLSQWQCTPGGT